MKLYIQYDPTIVNLFFLGLQRFDNITSFKHTVKNNTQREQFTNPFNIFKLAMKNLLQRVRKSSGIKNPEKAETKNNNDKEDSEKKEALDLEGNVKEKVDKFEKINQGIMDFNDMPPKEELESMFENFLRDYLGDAPGRERDIKEKMMRSQTDQAKWKIIKMNSMMKVGFYNELL